MSNDNVIEGQFTVKDEEDLAKLNDASDVTTYNPILKVWRAILEPAEDGLLNDPITPMWATRITSSYREVNFKDMGEVKERYYNKLVELRNIVDEIIASDDECLNVLSAEEDLEHNAAHYRRALLDWQLAIVKWEVEWDYPDPNAGAEIAAISEVQQMFFGSQQRQGITAYLESINLELTDDDRQSMAEAIEDYRVSLIAGEK